MSFAALLVAWSLSAAQADTIERPHLAQKAAIVVKVTDRVQAADALARAAEQLGGYFSERTDEAITLKVPAARVAELIAAVAPLGVVVERSRTTTDVGESLAQKRALLASREGMLTRYYAVLATAQASAVVEIESAMTELVQEIESLNGEIRVLEHESAFGAVLVRFEFRDRRAPARSATSSFAWLNTINLMDLIEEFTHE